MHGFIAHVLYLRVDELVIRVTYYAALRVGLWCRELVPKVICGQYLQVVLAVLRIYVFSVRIYYPLDLVTLSVISVAYIHRPYSPVIKLSLHDSHHLWSCRLYVVLNWRRHL